ncbi:MAG: fibrinogen-related protein [Persicimonas sp.]
MLDEFSNDFRRVHKQGGVVLLLAALAFVVLAGCGESSVKGSAAASCTDGVQNGEETDVDCGGPECPGCELESPCEEGTDCASGHCEEGECVEGSCDDDIKNGDEIDIDCGGDCGPCPTGADCDEDDDCVGGVCDDGICAHSGCDGVECGDDEVCRGGLCQSTCESPEDCPDGSICREGACFRTDCSDVVCDADERCHNGICRPYCEVDSDCPDEQVCVGEACTLDCPSGQQQCDDECTNLDTSSDHCGSCGYACDDGEACIEGECEPSCGTGLTECGDMCTNTDEDPQNCGECGNECDAPENAYPGCAEGVCGFVCEEHWGDCNDDRSDGCELDLYDNDDNCGECGNECEAGPNGSAFCNGDTCDIECDDGYEFCDDSIEEGCTDTDTDGDHCGACGESCSSEEVCVEGSCELVQGVGTSEEPFSGEESLAANCRDYESGFGGTAEDGLYEVEADGSTFLVYCDMTEDGGGWTLVLQAPDQDPDNSTWCQTSSYSVPSAPEPNGQTFKYDDGRINALRDGGDYRLDGHEGVAHFFEGHDYQHNRVTSSVDAAQTYWTEPDFSGSSSVGDEHSSVRGIASDHGQAYQTNHEHTYCYVEATDPSSWARMWVR